MCQFHHCGLLLFSLRSGIRVGLNIRWQSTADYAQFQRYLSNFSVRRFSRTETLASHGLSVVEQK
jgi:hypothetical protein